MVMSDPPTTSRRPHRPRGGNRGGGGTAVVAGKSKQRKRKCGRADMNTSPSSPHPPLLPGSGRDSPAFKGGGGGGGGGGILSPRMISRESSDASGNNGNVNNSNDDENSNNDDVIPPGGDGVGPTSRRAPLRKVSRESSDASGNNGNVNYDDDDDDDDAGDAILLSLEESLDWHEQTTSSSHHLASTSCAIGGGIVAASSSPLAAPPPALAPVVTPTNAKSAANAAVASTFKDDDDDENDDDGDDDDDEFRRRRLIKPIALTRSLESILSSSSELTDNDSLIKPIVLTRSLESRLSSSSELTDNDSLIKPIALTRSLESRLSFTSELTDNDTGEEGRRDRQQRRRRGGDHHDQPRDQQQQRAERWERRREGPPVGGRALPRSRGEEGPTTTWTTGGRASPGRGDIFRPPSPARGGVAGDIFRQLSRSPSNSPGDGAAALGGGGSSPAPARLPRPPPPRSPPAPSPPPPTSSADAAASAASAYAAATVRRHNRSSTMLGDAYMMSALGESSGTFDRSSLAALRLNDAGSAFAESRGQDAGYSSPSDDGREEEEGQEWEGEEEEEEKDRNVVFVAQSSRQPKPSRPRRDDAVATSSHAATTTDARAVGGGTRRKAGGKQQKVKRNNLVIQLPPLPSFGPYERPPGRHGNSRQQQRQSPSQSSSSSSSSRLPPPHPLAKVLMSPPPTYPIAFKRQPYHGHSNSMNSIMSETSSAAESEATPRISQVGRDGGGGGRGGGWRYGEGRERPSQGHQDRTLTFSFSDDDDDDINVSVGVDVDVDVDDDNDEVVGVRMVDGEIEGNKGGGAGRFGRQVATKERPKCQRPIPITSKIPFSELKGIDISFSRQDEVDSDAVAASALAAGTMRAVATTAVDVDPRKDHPRVSPTKCEDPRNDDKFVDISPIEENHNANDNNDDGTYSDDDNEGNHTRQFSSDDRFFEGIHNSGLQSLSFEQVGDADLNTCLDVEIELVYNTSNSNLGSFDTDDEVDREGGGFGKDERKEMEKRILQWRRGRHAWMMNAEGSGARRELGEMGERDKPGQLQQQHQEQQREENFDVEDICDYDDVELAPLKSSPIGAATAPTNIKINGSSAFDVVCSNSNHSMNSGGRHAGEQANDHRAVFPTPSDNSSFGRGSFATSTSLFPVIWNYLVSLWHVTRQYSNECDELQRAARTPRMDNSHLSPQPTAFGDDDDDNDDDRSEVRGLTSSSNFHERRRQSKYYNKGDYFDRYADLCRRYCCGGTSSTWQLHSGWKKLLLISTCLLVLAWVSIESKTKKHREDQVSLGMDNFIKNGANIDDGDDYYESSTLQSFVEDDHRDHFSSSIPNHQQDPAQSDGLEVDLVFDTAASAASSESVPHKASNIQFNKFVGIDTISVLGICERHPSIAWLVDRLKRLYPDMRVMSGFPRSDVDANEKPARRTLQNTVNHSRLRSSARFAKVIDPTSNKVIRHFGSDGEDASIDNVATEGSDAHQKSKNGHILVVAVSVNPYAWVELMRVDSQHDPRYAPITNHDGGILGWEEYAKALLTSVNGTILDLRAKNIRSVVVESAQHDGVRVVIPLQFEDLVEPYSNYDNFVSDESLTLPGIVGLLDQIQARTGLHADESSGWQESSKEKNLFWADPVGCTGHICFPSVNTITEDLHFIRFMNNHIDWSAEQLIGYQRRSEPKPSVDQIVVLGERWSGAEWLVDRLARCFPNTLVKYGFSRPGKWFQSEPALESYPPTLVVSVFLNPLDWVENMRQSPINAPAHKGMNWSEFVGTAWVRKRSHLDETLSGTVNANCSYGFLFEEVVPCMTERDPQSDAFPLYELHPASSLSHAGDPYSSILELRADKIRNFLSAATFNGVVDLISVRYEDLVWAEDYTDDGSYLILPFPGIAGLLERIRDRTSLIPDVDAGWISDEDGTFKAEPLGVGAVKLDSHYVQWMADHADWDAEKLVGYSS